MGSIGSTTRYDLVVVGGAINGMVCALLARQKGLEVLLLEANGSLGGGVRTEQLTLPGFQHDVCSAIHPFGRSSPVLRELNLEEEGLQWVDPQAPLAHPFLEGEAVFMHRSIEETCDTIGSRVYGKLMRSLVTDWDRLEDQLLGPPLTVPKPESLFPLFRFGPAAVAPAGVLGRFFGERGAALWAGLAAHSFLPLESAGSSAVACVLALLGHKVGWPLPGGGAAAIAQALEKKLRRAGVEVETGRRINRMAELPPHRAVVLDLSAKQLLSVVGPLLPPRLRARLHRYRRGPGVFKVDYALSEPVPWSDPRVGQAGTVHVGGDWRAIAASEHAANHGEVSEEPFVLVVQPSLFDPSRAPEGKHTLWAYIHTPNGWNGDGLPLLEGQLERFAPGFRDTVLARSVRTNADFERNNPNFVGGDIMGGENSLYQILARPQLSLDPYHLGGNLFCCSASVPPGGGVHGMGGYHAFRSVMKRHFPDL